MPRTFDSSKQDHKKSPPSAARDTVQIMSDAFQPAQLQELLEGLALDGHNCSVFTGTNGIEPALDHPRTKLLFLGSAEDDLTPVLDVLRSRSTGAPEIPVILYLKKSQCDIDQHLPEVDDFLLEPLNMSDIRLRVRRLMRAISEKQDELEQIKVKLTSHFGMRQFIGKAPSFLATIEKIPRVASCDAPVLLSGETGTGKEMCARAIHYLSPRANKPFIPVNCGSIPAELFENEMFGHEPGAFTDARKSRRGLIAEAEGGTLFLDEVDSLPPAAQVKLLRFLQDRQYRPLGASQYRQANTRILAASNQNLLRKVREQSFREDLYYRLKVITLNLPLLSERREDIMLIASHFLTTAACEYNRPIMRFAHDAVQKLNSHSWPGNVRELENAIRQAVILADGPVLRARDIHLSTDVPEQEAPAPLIEESFKAAKARVIETFERNYLSDIVAACDGNISRAARAAKKDRRSFFELLKKHDLTTPYERSFMNMQVAEAI
ncbi:MAG TPA: sigma-54 dependent transcriptional regulator [Pyrinomonadaceae bacterium]